MLRHVVEFVLSLPSQHPQRIQLERLITLKPRGERGAELTGYVSRFTDAYELTCNPNVIAELSSPSAHVRAWCATRAREPHPEIRSDMLKLTPFHRFFLGVESTATTSPPHKDERQESSPGRLQPVSAPAQYAQQLQEALLSMKLTTEQRAALQTLIEESSDQGGALNQTDQGDWEAFFVQLHRGDLQRPIESQFGTWAMLRAQLPSRLHGRGELNLWGDPQNPKTSTFKEVKSDSFKRHLKQVREPFKSYLRGVNAFFGGDDLRALKHFSKSTRGDFGGQHRYMVNLISARRSRTPYTLITRGCDDIRARALKSPAKAIGDPEVLIRCEQISLGDLGRVHHRSVRLMSREHRESQRGQRLTLSRDQRALLRSALSPEGLLVDLYYDEVVPYPNHRSLLERFFLVAQLPPRDRLSQVFTKRLIKDPFTRSLFVARMMQPFDGGYDQEADLSTLITDSKAPPEPNTSGMSEREMRSAMSQWRYDVRRHHTSIWRVERFTRVMQLIDRIPARSLPPQLAALGSHLLDQLERISLDDPELTRGYRRLRSALKQDERWYDLAQGHPLALLSRARLSLKRARVEEALSLLLQIKRLYAGEPTQELQGESTYASWSPIDLRFINEDLVDHILVDVYARLGDVHVLTRHVLQLQEPHYLMIAELAERLLSVDEALVVAQELTLLDQLKLGFHKAESQRLFASVLFKRLVRVGRLLDADRLLHRLKDKIASVSFYEMTAHVTGRSMREELNLLLRAQETLAQPRPALYTEEASQQAERIFLAACVTRHDGIELRGTMLSPDWELYDGDYQDQINSFFPHLLGLEARLKALELERQTSGVHHRFHYRDVAVQLALSAARLLPHKSQESVQAVWHAAYWSAGRENEQIPRDYARERGQYKRCWPTLSNGFPQVCFKSCTDILRSRRGEAPRLPSRYELSDIKRDTRRRTLTPDPLARDLAPSVWSKLKGKLRRALGRFW